LDLLPLTKPAYGGGFALQKGFTYAVRTEAGSKVFAAESLFKLIVVVDPTVEDFLFSNQKG
jgi:hypothetical protein